MKISPDQINALDQKQNQVDNKKPTKEAFGDVFAREAEKDAKAVNAKAPAPPMENVPVDRLLMAQQAAQDGQKASGRHLMDNIESLLSQWENYAAVIGKPGSPADLKSAYGNLESIESGIKDLKTGMPNMAAANPELKSVVDELEIMAVTERIKFDRGDYMEE
jgi:hypothetical protein